MKQKLGRLEASEAVSDAGGASCWAPCERRWLQAGLEGVLG
jgi:hypothetical protein